MQTTRGAAPIPDTIIGAAQCGSAASLASKLNRVPVIGKDRGHISSRGTGVTSTSGRVPDAALSRRFICPPHPVAYTYTPSSESRVTEVATKLTTPSTLTFNCGGGKRFSHFSPPPPPSHSLAQQRNAS
ncbi:hypothetical protein J6590_009730 [Homalodisca vitripennis]|nr:hypothetical protein J6590_009730 [Homalodisca vitripennis]